MSNILTNKELYLVYQAQWHHGTIVSYEALLRHISGGDVFPRVFFESLSVSDQQEVTLAIISDVIEQIHQLDLPIAFNLPARLLNHNLVKKVIMLKDTVLEGFLRCEIVEDEPLQEENMPLLKRLSDAGIDMVIDDLIEHYSIDNLAMFEHYSIPCIIKVEMKPEYHHMLDQYRQKGYMIIQEGPWVDSSSGDILQSNALSVPERLSR